MIKKSITYHDFEGQEYTKDFCFSISQTEFALLNNEIPGGLENYLAYIQQNRDSARIINLLTLFIKASYGELSADGVSFYKKDAQGRNLGEAFVSTEACDNLMSDLLAGENQIAAFLVGILPSSIRGKVEAGIREAQTHSEEIANGTMSTQALLESVQ